MYTFFAVTVTVMKTTLRVLTLVIVLCTINFLGCKEGIGKMCSLCHFNNKFMVLTSSVVNIVSLLVIRL